jgi:hypothetical protein
MKPVRVAEALARIIAASHLFKTLESAYKYRADKGSGILHLFSSNKLPSRHLVQMGAEALTK